MNDPKNFFAALFDISFSSFIIPKILKFLFLIGIIFSGLGAIVFLVTSLLKGTVTSILMGIIVAPIMFLLYAILIRVYCELLLVFFSLRENVQRMADHMVGGAGPSGGPVDGRGIVHSPSSGGAAPSPVAAPSPAAAPAPSPTPAPTPAQTPPTGGGGGGGGWS